jgi:asparagine synthase (glutamine-hydrolysing)
MCGIVGWYCLDNKHPVDQPLLEEMTRSLAHRGPDEESLYIKEGLGVGFRRLSIVDLENGHQPLMNEDESVVCICNGEVFNYRELRSQLVTRGHRFRTMADVEVIPHLYEEVGLALMEHLNAQFAFALVDWQRNRLVLARDAFGIQPLYYTIVGDQLLFASEIKALLRHPGVLREVDLVSLDQLLALPAIVPPRTVFKHIRSVPPGSYLVAENGDARVHSYWDLNYPKVGEISPITERDCIDRLGELFEQSVRRRLRADVPVGFYLSGGLDSSLIASMAVAREKGSARHSFSIVSHDAALSEEKYQQLIARHVGSMHHNIRFGAADICRRLRQAVYHSECPLKETYNTASLALSEEARIYGVRVVLSGEGADELFAGYAGYRFDEFNAFRTTPAAAQAEVNFRYWGEARLTYDKPELTVQKTRAALFSPTALKLLGEIDDPGAGLIDHRMIQGRHPVHQRSYIDFKIRLAGHLLADHGDRMAMAHSVEARYPFLDTNFVSFATQIPPELKLQAYIEKYILKRIAEDIVPPSIVRREKFPFAMEGSPCLLTQKIDWINEILDDGRIRREGFFNPIAVRALRERYAAPGFRLNVPYEDDLVLFVITFGILKEQFQLPSLN